MIILDDIVRITDVFTGADGGVDFVKLRCALEDLEVRADCGDAAAREVIQIAVRFRRLIDVLTGGV